MTSSVIARRRIAAPAFRIARLLATAALVLAPQAGRAQLSMSIQEIFVRAYPDITVKLRLRCGGLPVTSLPAATVALREDGVDVPSFTVTHGAACCFSAGLIFVSSATVTWPTLPLLKQAGKAFVSQMDPACDEAAVFSYGSIVTIQQFLTSDTASIARAIDAYTTGGGRAIYDAVYAALTEVAKGTRPCRGIVLTADGPDSTSTRSLDLVTAAAAGAGIPVYTIGFSRADTAALRSLSTGTGGVFRYDDTGLNLVDLFRETLYDIEKLPPWEVTYATRSCPAGARHRVGVDAGVTTPVCGGTASDTSSFTAPLIPKDLTPITVRLDSASTHGTDDVDLPLVLETPFHGEFAPVSFDVLFDSVRGRCLGVSTNGTLLDGIPMRMDTIPGGIRCTTTGTAHIAGPGVLARFHFRATSSHQDQFWSLTPDAWHFDGGCVFATVLPGFIRVRHSTLEIRTPNGGEILCAGARVPVAWKKDGLGPIDVFLSSNGGVTYPQLVARAVADTSIVWVIPPDQKEGLLYRMTVVESGGLAYDESDGVFSIAAVPIVRQSPAAGAGCPGDTVRFFASSSSFFLTGRRWELSDDGGATWRTVPGVESDTLLLPVAGVQQHGRLARYRAVNPCGDAASEPAMLSVTAPPSVLEQPRDARVCLGDSVSLHVGADGASIRYQWRKDGAIIPGGTQQTLRILAAQMHDEGAYDVVVSGACAPPAISAAAHLAVDTLPAIESQPRDTILCEGTGLRLSAVAHGADLRYQWQHDGTDMPGQTSSVLIVPDVRMQDAGFYSVLTTDRCGKDLRSDSAFVTIRRKAVIIRNPEGVSACPGDTVAFYAAAVGDMVRMRWQRSIDNGATYTTLENDSTFTYRLSGIGPADNGTLYRLLLTGPCGSVASYPAMVTVGLPPVIVSQPRGDSVCSGASVILAVKANAKNQRFQWYRDGVAIDGAERDSLVLRDVTPEAAGRYHVRIMTPCSSASSDTALVFAGIPPAILRQPQDVDTVNFGTAHFAVSAGGTALRFQWLKDGVPIPGARDSVYAILRVTPADTAVYSADVLGFCPPAVRSNGARLRLITVAGIMRDEQPYPLRVLPAAPNPFSDRTILRFSLAAPSSVDILISDPLGRMVLSTHVDMLPAGIHEIPIMADTLPAGMLISRISASGGAHTAVLLHLPR